MVELLLNAITMIDKNTEWEWEIKPEERWFNLNLKGFFSIRIYSFDLFDETYWPLISKPYWDRSGFSCNHCSPHWYISSYLRR